MGGSEDKFIALREVSSIGDARYPVIYSDRGVELMDVLTADCFLFVIPFLDMTMPTSLVRRWIFECSKTFPLLRAGSL